jgi:hypothetical protein
MNTTIPLKQVITANKSTLEKLFEQSAKLMSLTQLMQKKIGAIHPSSAVGYDANHRQTKLLRREDELPLLDQHCCIAKYSKGVLVLAVDNASWATQVRYHTPDIIEALKILPEFNKLKTIQCFVQAKRSPKIYAKPVRSKSDLEQARLLRKNAEAVIKPK